MLNTNFKYCLYLLSAAALALSVPMQAEDAWALEHETLSEPCSVLLNEDGHWKVVVSLANEQVAEIAFPGEVPPKVDDLYEAGVHFESRQRSGPVETRLHAFVEKFNGDSKAYCQQFMQRFFDRLVMSERPLKPQISSKLHTLYHEGQSIPCYSYRADFSPWAGRQAVTYFNIYILGDQVITVSANVMWSPWRVTPKERDWSLARRFLEGIRLTSSHQEDDEQAVPDENIGEANVIDEADA